MEFCNPLHPAGRFYTTAPDLRRLVGDSPGELVGVADRQWELDHDWLRAWLLDRADPSGTPYVGMRRLLPGQELRQRGAATVVVDTIGPEVWPEPDLSGQDAVHAMVEAFDAVVAELSAGQAEVACELSGGLDSTFMVASLARRPGGAPNVRAYTHVPDDDAVLRPGRWLPSDAAAARTVAERYPGRVRWQVVSNTSGRGPLEMARLVSARAWWPAYGPGNLEWLDTIRTQAADAGLSELWVGTHGNAAFSRSVPDVRSGTRWRRAYRTLRQRDRSRPEPLPSLLRVPRPTRKRSHRTPEREHFLRWLAGQHSAHSGLMNPAAFAVSSVDPFRHRLVLDTAARITDDGWRTDGVTRGLARAAGAGRVPDEVRMRVPRGGQGLDVWHWMYHDSAMYHEHVEALADTPAIADLVDIDAVRALVDGWPWGGPVPPPKVHTSVVNRLLAFCAFIRDTTDRLAISQG